MSGLFFAAGVFAWEASSGLRASRATRTLLVRSGIAWNRRICDRHAADDPWLIYVVHAKSEHTSSFDGRRDLTPRFWYFGREPTRGLGLESSLGAAVFVDFHTCACDRRVPTYGIAVVHVALCAIGRGRFSPPPSPIVDPPKRRLESHGRPGHALRSVVDWLLERSSHSAAPFLYRHYLVITSRSNGSRRVDRARMGDHWRKAPSDALGV